MRRNCAAPGRPKARRASRATATIALLGACGLGFAQQPAPFTHGDARTGKTLVERDCIACHEQKFKPASAIYTRSDRRVTTASQLLTQVQVCNTELRAGYFPDDEESVAAFLNEAYYKFKP